jgi:hypothetical protein
VLDSVGVGEHYIAAGTYDVYFEYHPASGAKQRVALEGVIIGSGAVWEQRFEAKAMPWLPAPARLPSAPLRSIHWSPAPSPEVVLVEGSASDDDDSAGDDDDSGRPATAQPAEKSTERVIKGEVPEHERAEAPAVPPSEGP